MTFARILLLVLLTLFPLHNALANIKLIVDDEIQMSLKELASPLFKAAGIPSNHIDFYIVNDNSINAYVMQGNSIFLHSGLLTKFFSNPDVILGVIAHELGHIKEGHIPRHHENIKKYFIGTVGSFILGGLAAASGSGDAAVIALLGMHTMERTYLQHSRQNERAADQSAINFLNKSNNSAVGLKQLLEYFRKDMNAGLDKLNPYTLTHPLDRERLLFVDNQLRTKSNTQSNIPIKVRENFIRSMVKLKSFLAPAETTLKSVQGKDDFNSVYARIIALYKDKDTPKALNEINELIKQYPNDAFVHELKAQILYDFGKEKEAIESYEKAHRLKPSALYITLALASAKIAFSEQHPIQSKQLLNSAIVLLKQVILNQGPETIFAIRQLSTAYGRLGNIGMANYMLAEEALLLDNKMQAGKFARFALQKLPKNSFEYDKAKEIMYDVKKELK